MKKEVFLAVMVGFVLGLIITFGIWTANNSLKNQSRPSTAGTGQNISPTPAETQPAQTVTAIPLNFTAPAEDETLVSTNALTLTGKTAPGAVVAIMRENEQDLVTADDNGNFSLDITLDGGYNRINATAFDKNGNTAKASFLITYTTSKI
jgi:hypothetical protein